MKKEIIRSPKVPETGGPFSLCIRQGDRVYVSGLPPFQEDFCEGLRKAREEGAPLPVYPRKSIEDETVIVMNHSEVAAGGGRLLPQSHAEGSGVAARPEGAGGVRQDLPQLLPRHRTPADPDPDAGRRHPVRLQPGNRCHRLCARSWRHGRGLNTNALERPKSHGDWRFAPAARCAVIGVEAYDAALTAPMAGAGAPALRPRAPPSPPDLPAAARSFRCIAESFRSES